MINLLPLGERTHLIGRYRLRFAIVSMVLLLAVLFLGLVFLLPAYFSVRSKVAVAERSLEITKSLSRNSDGESPEYLIKDLQKKIGIIESRDKRIFPSVLIGSVLGDIPAGVTIESISLREGKDGIKIYLSGKSGTRSSLLSFSNALEKNKMFSSVDLPVSSLVRERDLSYTLELGLGAK